MKVSLKAGATMPKTIGLCADAYHEVKAFRLAMQKEVDAVYAREAELREHIIENLAVDSKGARGRKYRAVVKSEEYPTVEDWAMLYEHIQKRPSRFSLLGKKLNNKKVKEAWGTEKKKKKLPGVGVINIKSVSVTKI